MSLSFFEAGMLVCFGASWPFALRATFISKSIKGKSLLFLSLVLLGYIFGILHKIVHNCDFVIWLYIINAIFVLADIVLYFTYRKNQTSQQ